MGVSVGPAAGLGKARARVGPSEADGPRGQAGWVVQATQGCWAAGRGKGFWDGWPNGRRDRELARLEEKEKRD